MEPTVIYNPSYKGQEANLHYEGDIFLPEADWRNKTLLDVMLLMCKILVEVCFDFKSIQVLSYWSLALPIIEEGNMLPVFQQLQLYCMFRAKLSI